MAKKNKNKKKTVKPKPNQPKAMAAGRSDKTAVATTSTKKKAPARDVVKGPNIFIQVRQFFREVRVELRKVSWPSRQEYLASTAVVIVLVFIVSTYLGLVDIGLSRLMKYILK